MSNLRRTALTAIASLSATLAVFLAAEAAVRLIGIEPMPWPTADVPEEVPQILVDPLLGSLPRPGYSGDWLEFEAEIDDRGFRATGFPPPEEPRARVAFLGDSCSFGWGVPTASTFVAQLDELQRRRGAQLVKVAKLAGHVDTQPPLFELANAAYPGHTAVVGQYMLAERVLPIGPDFVILAFSANNAFRLAVAGDVVRFRHFALRKLILSSRLLHILAAKLANRGGPPGHPRDRNTVLSTPYADLHRVATPAEYEAAQRAMVAAARSAGAVPVFLLFPRASQVSTLYRWEDPGLSVREVELPPRDGRGLRKQQLASMRARELNLIEGSCLDHRKYQDPVGELREKVASWQPVRPGDNETLAVLREGAHNYVAGHYAEASRRFAEAVARQPDSPLALYDWGASQIMNGDTAAGLNALARADRLACNAFLQYNVLAWKIAAELEVPVIDLTLHFQTRGDAKLFRDPAHPNAAGHHLIAEALWQELTRLAGA